MRHFVSLLLSVHDIPGKVARVAVAVKLQEWFVGEWNRCVTTCPYLNVESQITKGLMQIVRVV
jgi:hypothetical protein